MTELKDTIKRTKARQYAGLKKMQSQLDARMGALRLGLLELMEEGEVVEGLKLQKKDRTTFNKDRVFIRMDAKGIHRLDYCRFEPDAGLIESLYLEGVLDDNDLRYIREPKHSYALVEVGEESANDGVEEL